MSAGPSVIIVGGGIGGLTAAIELQAHGFREITVLERGEDIGGTWLSNTYPGAACDVPSHAYSFSFAQRHDWSRLCSPQPEILRYLHGVAREYGIDGVLQTGVEVVSCAFEEDAHRWTVSAADGRSWEADALIIATGQLHQPAVPRLPGLEDFAGHSFHSARWDHDYSLRGKRVAVIGTGASAVQFVPEVAEQADRLVVFQRTGNWFLPRRNRAYPAPYRWLIGHVPGLQALRRSFWFQYGEFLTFMIRHPRTIGRLGALVSSIFMRSQLTDPDLRRRIWPDYTFGCKRVLFSSHFLPALQRPNVTVETSAIERLTASSIHTADGAEHEIDCLIYATGFRTTEFMFPMEITGREGRSLREAWSDGPHAHLGISVPGFPSLFILYGPNTNTSGGSIIAYLEAQAGYVRQALALLRDRGASAIEVRPEVEARSDRELQSRFAGTAWTRCNSWYRDDHGRIVTNWPGYMWEYFERTRRLDPAEYELAALPDRQAAAA